VPVSGSGVKGGGRLYFFIFGVSNARVRLRDLKNNIPVQYNFIE